MTFTLQKFKINQQFFETEKARGSTLLSEEHTVIILEHLHTKEDMIFPIFDYVRAWWKMSFFIEEIIPFPTPISLHK